MPADFHSADALHHQYSLHPLTNGFVGHYNLFDSRAAAPMATFLLHPVAMPVLNGAQDACAELGCRLDSHVFLRFAQKWHMLLAVIDENPGKATLQRLL